VVCWLFFFSCIRKKERSKEGELEEMPDTMEVVSKKHEDDTEYLIKPENVGPTSDTSMLKICVYVNIGDDEDNVLYMC